MRGVGVLELALEKLQPLDDKAATPSTVMQQPFGIEDAELTDDAKCENAKAEGPDEGVGLLLLFFHRGPRRQDNAALRGWWEDVNESPAWQGGAFFALTAAYALVSAVALIQLVRIQRRVPEFGWTTQKVFHLMNFVVNGVRAVVFGFHAYVFLLQTKVYKLVLLDLPGLLFFSAYTLLVLFWAEIYHQARSLPTDKLRIIYLAVNSIVYVIQVCIWVYLGINDNPLVELVSKIFIVSVSAVALLGFAVYGGRLFVLLRRFPIESKGRKKKLYEVGTVTTICCTCFLIRCIVVAVSAFDADVSLEVLDHPILDFFYYMLTEILPSALVLFILRKLPPKRVSAQYHPIN